MNLTKPRVAVCALALTGALAAGTAATGAFASTTTESTMLQVSSTSLTQSGQDLVWSIKTTSALKPASFAASTSLCLDLSNQQLCLTAAKSGHHRILLARTSARGAKSTIQATVVRNSATSLSVTFLAADAAISTGTHTYNVQSTGACPAATATNTSSHAGANHDFRSNARGSGCAQAESTATQQFRFHTPKLVGCEPNRSSVVFNGSRTTREVALTFDDGPWPDPPSIDFVKLLHKLGAVGTFFEIGDQISEYDRTGSVERLMLADGDMIGNHSWTHPDMLNLSVAGQTSQLLEQRAAVKRATGFTECLFRPPYGDFDSQLVKLAGSDGMATIQWDVDTADWTLPGVSKIYSTAVDDARNGSIILMHFGGGPRYETITALPEIIRTLRARGFKFVTVPELLGFKMIYR